MSTSQTQNAAIDKQVRQITDDTFSRASEGLVTNREIAVAVEANQAYIDYLDWLKDNIQPIDLSVTVEVNKTQIKFKNVDDFSNWLAEIIT